MVESILNLVKVAIGLGVDNTGPIISDLDITIERTILSSFSNIYQISPHVTDAIFDIDPKSATSYDDLVDCIQAQNANLKKYIAQICLQYINTEVKIIVDTPQSTMTPFYKNLIEEFEWRLKNA